jgi:hypothetical protein
MPKEKPHHGGRPIRGGDTFSITEKEFSGNIPQTAIDRLEREIQNVNFGSVSLIVSIRDKHPTFRIEKTVSIITGD